MTHSIARLDGTPIVEMRRLENLDLWSVLLATGRLRIVSGHEITAAIRDDRITEDDVLTAQQWEIEQHFDVTLEAADWDADTVTRCGTYKQVQGQLTAGLVVLLMVVGVVLGAAVWFSAGAA